MKERGSLSVLETPQGLYVNRSLLGGNGGLWNIGLGELVTFDWKTFFFSYGDDR